MGGLDARWRRRWPGGPQREGCAAWAEVNVAWVIEVCPDQRRHLGPCECSTTGSSGAVVERLGLVDLGSGVDIGYHTAALLCWLRWAE